MIMAKCNVCDSPTNPGATACGSCGSALGNGDSLLQSITVPAAGATAGGAKEGDTCEVCTLGKLKLGNNNELHCDQCGAACSAPAAATTIGVDTPAEEDLSAVGHSRGSSVSARLAGLTVHGSTSKTVLMANMEASGTVKTRAVRNAGSTRSHTFTTLGCGIIDVEPQIPADPQTSLKTKEQVSIPREKRCCSNPQCTGDQDQPLDWSRPLTITFSELTNALLDELMNLGVDIEHVDQAARTVLATVPERKVDAVRALKGVTNVQAIYHTVAKLEEDHEFCPWCGTEYWFVPNLNVGDVVANQYEVRGYIARGGFGIIYLAWDREVGRFVVLKGVANANDPVALKAAVEEKRHLADLDHPKIVKIYGFKEHEGVSYIVMQYVGGVSLKQVIKERTKNKKGPLPPMLAMAYIQGILDAFDYLHKKGLVYRDFKPDNIMLVDDTVMLIDLGAVVPESEQVQTINNRIEIMPVLYTLGYNPLETVPVDQNGLNKYGEPVKFTFNSDRFTIIRSLAVMAVDFKFNRDPYLYGIPDAKDVKLFRKYPSFHRLLLKGLRENPDERYQSTQEIGEALVGVMREMKCVDDWLGDADRAVHPRHFDSPYFTTDTFAGGREYTVSDLPSLKPDPRDSAGGFVQALMGLPAARQIEMLQPGLNQYPKSWEVKLRLATAYIESRAYDKAEAILVELAEQNPFDWRITWTRMLSCFAQGKFAEARDLAEAVYCELPGELAPKLARAFASEKAGDYESAIALYNLVSVCDSQIPSASFGLARATLAHKKGEATAARDTAAEAYARVPATSIAYNQAIMEMARMLCTIEPGEAELQEAARRLDNLRIEGYEFHRVRADVLIAAVQLMSKGIQVNPATRVFDAPLQDEALRLAAERELRAAAAAIKSLNGDLAYKLVVEANSVRPWTRS